MVEASPQRANMGYIGAIVAVATIGGFLFGYDSGAVNGTQEGLRQAFGLSDAGLGFTVGSLLIGCFIGAFLAGRLADLFGRRNVMMVAGGAVPHRRAGPGLRPRSHAVRHRPLIGRHGGRRGERAFAGLHLRSRPGAASAAG